MKENSYLEFKLNVLTLLLWTWLLWPHSDHISLQTPLNGKLKACQEQLFFFFSFPFSPFNFESGRIWFFDLPSSCQLRNTTFYFVVFDFLIWIKTWTRKQLLIETSIGTRKRVCSMNSWENADTTCSLCD